MSDWAENLAKILPVERVYNDALSPAVRQVGFALEDVVKAIRLATFPFQVAGASQDRLAAFLRDAVERVPLHRRVIPPPQIVGKVLEGMRYEPDGGSVQEMFSCLLSTSMDADLLDYVHPAFPSIIAQLSHCEAKFLTALQTAGRLAVTTLSADRASLMGGLNGEIVVELGSARQAASSIHHLEGLGLISVSLEELTDYNLDFRTWEIALSDFGETFLRAAFKPSESAHDR